MTGESISPSFRTATRTIVDANLAFDELRKSLSDVSWSTACPAEISGGLLRALFGDDLPDESATDASLSHRESEVLQLIGGGLTNKEIARELSLSVATVKHHVHSVLTKLQLPGRAQAMRRVRDAPWLAAGSRRQGNGR